MQIWQHNQLTELVLVTYYDEENNFRVKGSGQ